MIPLYAARIEDLGPRDFAKAECAACEHDRLILASALHRGLRLRRLPARLISRRMRGRKWGSQLVPRLWLGARTNEVRYRAFSWWR
jgi:hypothetical protein